LGSPSAFASMNEYFYRFISGATAQTCNGFSIPRMRTRTMSRIIKE
jgi:hypothetical protein